ncbi:MAG: hypothetical protein AAGB04_07035 [Pseudomonadota bacterium]
MLTSIKSSIKRFCKDESGAALMEYSILIGIVSATAVGLAFGARDWIIAQWQDLQQDLGTGPTAINNQSGGGTD